MMIRVPTKIGSYLLFPELKLPQLMDLECPQLIAVMTTKVTQRSKRLISLLQTSLVAGASSSRTESQEHNPGTRNGHPVSSILAAMLHPQEPLHTGFNLRPMTLLAIQTMVAVVQIMLCRKMVDVVGATTKVTESLPIIAKAERAMELIPLLQTLVVAGTSSSRTEWQEHNPGTRNSHPLSSILAAMLSPRELLHTVFNLRTMMLLTIKTVVAVV